MSTTTFQDATGSADVHGRERMKFHALCNQAAARVGVRGGPFNLVPMLNASIQSGDVTILAARIHGQSETCLYVEGPNRAWLAGIIESGCERGLFNREMGWDKAVSLLRSSDSEALAISTSQGDPFPNMDLAIEHETWSPNDEDEPDDEWYELQETERWEVSMKAIRAREQTVAFGWELKPDHWTTYRFRD